MKRDRIYLCLAHMSGQEQKFIKEAFDTNWVVPMGPNVNGFEADLERFVNRREGTEPQNKTVVCLSAGTAAVHLALLACGVGPGDEVLVQSFTFCASSHPVTYLGATPVLSIPSVRHGTWIPTCSKRLSRIALPKQGANRRRSFRSPFTGCLTGLTGSWRSPTVTGFP